MSDLGKIGANRPNPVVRSVAVLAFSVRTKLLIAFLGITFLLVGLTLFALTTLKQSNDRAEAMIHDQQRIAFFNDVYTALGELNSLNLALNLPKRSGNADDAFFKVPGSSVHDRAGDLELYLAHGVRRFGQEGMPDAKIISDLRADVKAIIPVVVRIFRLREEKNYNAAAAVGLDELWYPIRRMQREAYSAVQRIEVEMRNRARMNKQAYLTSRRSILAAALGAVCVSLFLGYSISSSLLWPIGVTRQALGRLAKGRFDARVSVPNRDELGELAEHVNQTSEKLGKLYGEVEAQKTQLADLNAVLEDKVEIQVEEIERTNRLRRFLPAQVAEMIVGATDEKDVLRTQRTEITVLFADLRGFTAFANAATPDQVVAALNTFHGTCGPLVEAGGATLERFLGDGVMILFGAPVPMEDAAQRAVDLAREMRAAISRSMAAFQAGTDGRGLGVGIGIATGAATLGQIGFEGRVDYAAIGPAPNLAARLCEVAGNGQILISHATAWQVESAMKPAGPFALKGIGQTVSAFELVTKAEGK